MGVFKVETVGDCYVAVCGLPDPRPDHPVVMAQFAAACLSQFRALVSSNKLSVQLGPGTSKLRLYSEKAYHSFSAERV
jgi:class 3 adenylate cyclase